MNLHGLIRLSTPLMTVAITLIIACGQVNLLATETPTSGRAPPPPLATSSPAVGGRFASPPCVDYDDYQASAMAFYALSAFVQSGLDAATEDTEGESLQSAMARFEQTVRRVLAGESVTPTDPVEELAIFWVVSDGCMR